MDNHEHLVENVIELVKKNGAYHLDCNNPGIYRQSIPCSELVSDDELKWLFHKISGQEDATLQGGVGMPTKILAFEEDINYIVHKAESLAEIKGTHLKTRIVGRWTVRNGLIGFGSHIQV